ncbi:MAG TPA: hypothetical protein VD995_26280 [Azospirillum sp.]|nr:hypothetical protein [Azospirillum sp.]
MNAREPEPPPAPPAEPSAEPPAEPEEPDPAELGRLTPEELAFLLGNPGTSEADAAERGRQRRAERNQRAGEARTQRRRTDPGYADALRAGDRERQRRRRGAPVAARSEPPVPLPPIGAREAARRLADFIQAGSPQAAQLRRKPDLVQRYVDGFVLYRMLSRQGARPTRGDLATAFRTAFGVALTPSQVQKLRDHIEGFARPGGPWHAG